MKKLFKYYPEDDPEYIAYLERERKANLGNELPGEEEEYKDYVRSLEEEEQ